MPLHGLNNMVRNLASLRDFSAELDGDLTSLIFDPHDPQSIDLAIQKMEAAIDEKAAAHGGGGMVNALAINLKDHLRNSILQHAASARAREAGEI